MNKNKHIIIIDKVSKVYDLGKNENKSYLLKDDIYDFFNKVFRSVKKKEKKFFALDNISFEINKGDVVGIVGPNGAGKSTLLKILSRITFPTRGSIHINGRVASLLEVGTGFNPELTGRENIYLNGAILGMNRREINEKVDDIINFSGIRKFIDIPVKRYSSGMYIRLAFSVAANLSSDILLIDEILSVGDAEFQKKSMRKMEEIIRSKDRTIIFVSHDLSTVEKVCNKAILLNKGKVVMSGETAKVISRYLHDIEKKINLNLKGVASKGSHDIFIKNIFLRNLSDKTISEVKNTESFYFCFEYTARQKCRDVVLGFNVSDVFGRSIFLNLNTYTDKTFDINKGSGVILFKIKSLPLVSGEYRLSYRLEANGIEADYPESFSYQFIVKDGGFYSGTIKPSNHSPVLVDGSWDIRYEKNKK